MATIDHITTDIIPGMINLESDMLVFKPD